MAHAAEGARAGVPSVAPETINLLWSVADDGNDLGQTLGNLVCQNEGSEYSLGGTHQYRTYRMSGRSVPAGLTLVSVEVEVIGQLTLKTRCDSV